MADEQLPRGVASIGSGRVEVHFDGSCQTIGGRRVAGYGFTVEGAGLDTEELGLAVPPGHPRATNNVAEYVGAICALEYLSRLGFAGEVAVIGDSELVIRQTNGEYSVRAEHLVPYADRLRQLAGTFRHAEFRWVPREENRRADELSKRAIEQAAPEPTRPAGFRGPRSRGPDSSAD